MAELQITFKVHRFKRGLESASHQLFTTRVDEDTTVLVALQDIRRDQDPSLTLRHSCHHASCGTCGMKINGQEQLACVVNVLELGTSTVLVEPLDNLPLISDLVVSMEGFFQKYSIPEMPNLRRSEFVPNAQVPPGIDSYQRFENCLECGLCVSACPITGTDPSYLGPASLAAAWRVVQEPRTANPQQALDRVDNKHGCWRCHVAYECSEVCPSDVDPAVSIMSIRNTIVRKRIRWFFGSGS